MNLYKWYVESVVMQKHCAVMHCLYSSKAMCLSNGACCQDTLGGNAGFGALGGGRRGGWTLMEATCDAKHFFSIPNNTNMVFPEALQGLSTVLHTLTHRINRKDKLT